MPWDASISGRGIAGLGLMVITTVGLYIGVRELLRPYHAANINYPPLPKTQYITQDTEDSLSLATLEKLLKHYNFSIRETAAKIVCDRAINDDDVLLVLLLGITRRDYDERMKHLRALVMLTDQHTLYRLNTVEGISAFVKSLEQCVLAAEAAEAAADPSDRADPNESPMIDDISFDEYYLRDIAEKLCLMFLAQLTEKYDVDLLVRYGFVRRWLAKQPWGPPAKRADNFARYLKYRDNRIADICRRLRESPSGRRALEKAGLVAPRQPLHPKVLHLNLRAAAAGNASDASRRGSALRGIAAVEAGTDNIRLGGMDSEAMIQAAQDVLTVLDAVVSANTGRARGSDGEGDGDGDGNGDSDAEPAVGDHASLTTSPTAGNQTGQPRPPSQSSRAEQRIRRQHREAMVLNDGTRPLRRDDIIERDSDSG
ncbi:MAG: hypothetical protein STHCBS139747_001100 [Sporothrix thermara]